MGSFSFRTTLLSTICLALSFALLCKPFSKIKNSWMVYLLAISLLLCPKLLQLGTRTEVYALSALLFSLEFYLYPLGKQDRRIQFVQWLIWALAMWNHPVIGLAFLPWLPYRSGSKNFIWVACTIPLALYLPLRSFRASFDFGQITSISTLIYFLRGGMYKAFGAITFAQEYEQLLGLTANLFQILGIVGLLLFAIGVYDLSRRDLKLLLRITLTLGISFFPVIRMSNFSDENPDLYGYIFPAIFLSICLVVIGFEAVLAKGEKFQFTPALLFLLVCTSFYGRKPIQSLDWSGKEQVELLLSEPPPIAMVSTASFETWSFMRFGQVAMGLRPDIKVDFRGFPNPPTHDPYVRPLSWELRIAKLSEKYSLGEEETQFKDRLTQTGWFYALDMKEKRVDMKEYRNRILKILSRSKSSLSYAKEALFLNAFNHLTLSQMRGEELRKTQFEEMIREFFAPYDPRN